MASPSLQFVPTWLKKPTTPGLDSPTTPSAFAFGNNIHASRNSTSLASNIIASGQTERGDFALQLPNGHAHGLNGSSQSAQSQPNRPKGIQRYSKAQLLDLASTEKARHMPSDLAEWTVQLGINGSVNSVGQHGGANGESVEGANDDPDGQLEDDRRPYSSKRFDRDRQDTTSSYNRRGPSAGGISHETGTSRPVGRALGGFGRGEGGGAFGGGSESAPSKGSRFSSLEGDNSDTGTPAGRDRKERNPWRDAEAGFRDKDRLDRLDRAEKVEREGGMSAGGRYIPANGFASPTTEKAGLSERRPVRGTLSRKDTGEIPIEKESSTPGRGLNQIASTWRPNLRQTPSATGFEGVLGSFGASALTPSKQKFAGDIGGPLDAAWKDREKERTASGDAGPGVTPGSGGGGWGKTGRWRAAAQHDSELETAKRPNLNPLESKDVEAKPTESTAVIPPATPTEERDNQMDDQHQDQAERLVASVVNESLPNERRQTSQAVGHTESIDPLQVQWLYQDPEGNEQGPFTAKAMQDWFAANYFLNTLPLRRSGETSFRSLQQLKEETQSDDRPFLTRPAPSLPPNLPIPSMSGNQGFINTERAAPLDEGASGHNDGSRSGQPNDTLRQMLADLQQTQISGLPQLDTRNVSSPMKSAILGTQSPALNIGRAIPEAFTNPGSYASSPVSQHAVPRSVWDTVASPAIGRSIPSSPFASEAVSGHLQHMGGFPQPQFGHQPRSIFEIPSQSPAQSPYAQSPWGVQIPPQMAHQMYQQPYPGSPFGQMAQQPFGVQHPVQPMNQPWPQQHQYMQQPQHSQQHLGSPSPYPVQPQELGEPRTNAGIASSQEQELSVAEYLAQQIVSPTPAAAQPSMELLKSPNPASGVLPPSEIVQQEQVPISEPATESVQAIQEIQLKPVIAPVQAKTKAAVQPISEKPVADKKQAKKSIEVVAPTAEALEVESRPASPPAAASPRVAPWAEEKVKPAKSMSLKEIQEVETRAAEKKRSAEAKIKAAAAAEAAARAPVEANELPQSTTFGLASRPALASVPSTGAASAPVWGVPAPTGSKKQMPKRSLQQIQDEERAKKLAQAKAMSASNIADSSSTKRGYADLAAVNASATTGGGWATIGAGGKAVTPVVPALAPVVAKPKPAPMVTGSTVNKPVAKSKAQALNDVNPSIEFIRWTKEQLKGLSGANVDEFIQMLLTFPVEPPQKDEMLEIIAESVYATSSTLDGKRFANNFYMRRKEDALDRVASNGKSSAAKVTSLADIVKTQPKTTGGDFGFKIVKKKGKKN